MLQAFYKFVLASVYIFVPDISWKIPRDALEVSRKFPESVLDVSWICPGIVPGNFPETSWKCPGNLQENSRKAPGKLPDVSWKFPRNAKEVN